MQSGIDNIEVGQEIDTTALKSKLIANILVQADVDLVEMGVGLGEAVDSFGVMVYAEAVVFGIGVAVDAVLDRRGNHAAFIELI